MRMLHTVPTRTQLDAGLLVLRVVLGVIFVVHGWQKVATFGVTAVGGGFEQMGIPLAGVMGPLVSYIELLGGVALIAGAFTRLAGLGVAAVMVGAIFFAHLPAGFLAPDGYEFPLMLLAAAAGLVLMGGGGWSVDAVVEQRLRSSAPAPATQAETQAVATRTQAA